MTPMPRCANPLPARALNGASEPACSPAPQMARRALATLQELTPLTSPTLVERDAAIQRFEYSTEACWKAAQSVLSMHFGLELASPNP